jgi:hypothetical protein
MKAETRVTLLMLQMAPLADWLKRFRPDCKQMSIRKRDHSFLLANASLARKHGIFVEHDEHITFRGFEILSTTCGGVSSDADEARHG